ncbi:Ankyrin repeat-containing protein [Phytophthora cinnamomi]|uniref:Ankyrin repeat-containing protein n=1 Tax=Phytophthora cinnamomi TaxID=4785 RepID=UPI00355A319F|nr:Ankyrin repeat-containing protein [Phytophthora cinnamomi]
MSWIDTYDVAVPAYQVTDGKVFFAIKLSKNDARAPAPASQSPNGVCTTLRSYSQFRRLWKTLRERVDEPARRHHHRHHLTLGTAHKCRCAEDRCEFDALHPMLQSFPFPSRRSLRSKFTGLDHAAVNERRDALAAFVALLHEFFSSFGGAMLREKLQDDSCFALKAYANFLGAAEHFPAGASAALHRPLALDGWRQQCAEQMMNQDEQEEDDGGFRDSEPEVSEVHLTAPRAVESRVKEASTPEEEDVETERTTLPSLQVKPVRVHTMHSFMEEFCEHVLSQFACDIDELNSPDLTEARRWEICLYVACRIGHTYAVQLILFNYADANTAMADGSSCLHIAARMGRTDIVALLLDEGADANMANDAGVTPLIAACRNGCVDVVKLLLDAGATVSACSKRGTYPLHAAIVSQNLEIVALLVDSGANVNVMTASGITPLHFAAKLGSLAISEYLLRHDADPEKRTKNDSDAMMIAEANGHATICELFQRFSGFVTSEQVGADYLLNMGETDKSPDMVRMLSQRRLSRASRVAA